MIKPWDNLCNNILPEYTIKSMVTTPGRGGTNIIIEGYVVDNPEKYFNFDTVKDYIIWFTAAGSFKIYFVNYPELNKYVYNMQIAPRVFVEDKILGVKEEISGVHPFYHLKKIQKQIDLKVFIRSLLTIVGILGRFIELLILMDSMFYFKYMEQYLV